MITLLATILLASLSGSLHCVGMCGPFVVFYAGTDVSEGRRRWLSHLAYNGGRLTTYALLGALAGVLGSAVDIAGRAADVQRAAALVAGGLMILWGVGSLLAYWGLRSGGGAAVKVPGPLARLLTRMKDRPPLVRALVLGLASTLLPCGWLYAFAVAAAATGDALSGAAVMAAFWLGTVPALLGLGAGLQRLARPLRKRIPLVAALVLVVMGVLALTSRVGPSNMALATSELRREADLASSVERIERMSKGEQQKPCCNKDGDKTPR